jgi:hypothetical protein
MRITTLHATGHDSRQRPTSATYIVPLRSHVAAARSHEPPRHSEMAHLTCHQKGGATKLLTSTPFTVISNWSRQLHARYEHGSAPIEHHSRQTSQATETHRGDPTQMPRGGLCYHSARTHRHTRNRRGLPHSPLHALATQQRPTLSRSDRTSLLAEVTSHRTTSRWPISHASRRAVRPSCTTHATHQKGHSHHAIERMLRQRHTRYGHGSAPIEHRCRRRSQATAPHPRDQTRRSAEGL